MNMSQIEHTVDQLKRAFDGEAWHGEALMEILEGVDADTAVAHPISGAHSIWELVLHLTTWERVIAHRMKGQALMPSDEENFPPVSVATDAAWREALQKLLTTHADLVQMVSSMNEAQLYEPVPGKDYALHFMLTGAVQHAAYHGGQIALLKKIKQ